MVFRSAIYILFSALLTLSCAQKKTKSLPTEVTQDIYYTTLVFEKGKSSLNTMNQESLRQLSARAHKKPKKIEEIKVLAWADAEYPNKSQGKGSKREILLASERAQKVRDFLADELKEKSEIDSYNMAKRPNLLSSLFRDEDFNVKKSFETTGVTGSKLPDGNVSYTKASKAIVIINYAGKEDDLKH